MRCRNGKVSGRQGVGDLGDESGASSLPAGPEFTAPPPDGVVPWIRAPLPFPAPGLSLSSVCCEMQSWLGWSAGGAVAGEGSAVGERRPRGFEWRDRRVGWLWRGAAWPRQMSSAL